MNISCYFSATLVCALLTGASLFSLSLQAQAAEKQAVEKNHDHASVPGGDTEHGHEEAALIDTDTLVALGAEQAVAGPGVIKRTVSLPGEVRLNQDAVARVSPRYASQLVNVQVSEGDTVKAGQVLAEAENSQTLQRFPLMSLIDGTVIRRNVTLGDQVQPSKPAFVVADLSTLWVDIALYPENLADVKEGQRVLLSTRSGRQSVKARIGYVAPQVNDTLRTGLARVFLDNRHGQWRPGMFVQADVVVEVSQAEVVVPLSALIEYEGNTVVWVRENHRWHPRKVTVAEKDSARIAVLSGLQQGETYLAKGGFIVKADLQKSEFESGHNH